MATSFATPTKPSSSLEQRLDAGIELTCFSPIKNTSIVAECVCHQLGPKPSVYPGLGKEWYPTWAIRDILNEVPQTSTPTDNTKNLNQSSFQEILLCKIRENKTRPSKNRQKINFLGAAITDEEYQREIAKLSSPKNSSEKMAPQKIK